MKKIVIYIFALLFPVFFFQGCEDMDDKINFSTDAKEFVWRGLNQYYFWQEEVGDLADNRFSGQQFNSFLASFQSPEDIFNHLLYQKGVVDRFSVIYSDYTVLEQLLSGNAKNNGVDYGLFLKSSNSDEVVGWVRYILPDSDASNKPIYRGDLFYAVNGTRSEERRVGKSVDLGGRRIIKKKKNMNKNENSIYKKHSKNIEII